MKSLEEMQVFLDGQGAESKALRHKQLLNQQAVALNISQLPEPFELWGRHVEAIRASYQRKLDSATQILTEKVLLGETYVHTKITQAEAKSAVDALNQALAVAKSLIEQGEKAGKELQQLDSLDKK